LTIEGVLFKRVHNWQILTNFTGGVQSLATHKSALKRAKQSRARRLRNLGYKTKAKKAVKEVRTALANNSADEARESLTRAISIIHKTASKGVIHKNKASRNISRLTHQVNKLTST
jgi:small subunit ribosomal protein S20